MDISEVTTVKKKRKKDTQIISTGYYSGRSLPVNFSSMIKIRMMFDRYLYGISGAFIK